MPNSSFKVYGMISAAQAHGMGCGGKRYYIQLEALRRSLPPSAVYELGNKNGGSARGVFLPVPSSGSCAIPPSASSSSTHFFTRKSCMVQLKVTEQSVTMQRIEQLVMITIYDIAQVPCISAQGL